MSRKSIVSRVLSIVLSAAMVVSMTPLAWADGPDAEGSLDEVLSLGSIAAVGSDAASGLDDAAATLDALEAGETTALLAYPIEAASASAGGPDAVLANVSGDHEYTVSDSKVTITTYNGTAADVKIPAEMDGCPVTAIGDEAFSDCAALASIEIPASVTSIGGTAFQGCTSLSEVRFAGSAPTFGSSVFTGVTATAYHSQGDSSWIESVRQDYGGAITWESYEAGSDPEPASIADAVVADIPDQVFTGSAVEPAVTVTCGDAALVEGTDYEVAYSHNVAVGTATAVITGIGNYTGTAECTFEIVAPQGCAALRGDANGNGVVNIVDAQIALDLANSVYGDSYESFPYPSAWGDAKVLWLKIAADANADGAITADDARAIQVYVHQGEWG